jgi:hypothetical protein
MADLVLLENLAHAALSRQRILETGGTFFLHYQILFSKTNVTGFLQ